MFFRVAQEVDYCVSHARLYEDVIRDSGVDTVTTISPGVDLDFFVPRLNIGVVGRTYHTGRKGEHIVAQVMDIPGIDWHFTGEGWPGPALRIPQERLPDFYRRMDYILVPALYEGGPMSVVEALACGTPVIAPPIGWVPQFPHIEYETGNTEELRRILEQLVQQKTRLRESTLAYTWDAWAEGHDRLFSKLMRDRGLAPAGSIPSEAAKQARVRSAALLTHGSEGSSLGGPTVRVPRTAQELRTLGVAAQAVRFPHAAVETCDVLHAFNVWSPKTALAVARRARWLNKPFVFSPIYLDLSQRRLWQDELLGLFEKLRDPEEIAAAIISLKEQHAQADARSGVPAEPIPGYHAMVRELIAASDHVILLSERERAFLTRIGAEFPASTIVHNPVDGTVFDGSDPTLFADEYGLRDYVLCVARVEPRKNQLMMVQALKDTGLPLVLVGHASAPKYLDLVKRHGGENLHVIDRLPPGSPLLASAFAGARVVVLPSWAEGAPLVALEAAASGASMVLSDRSGEQEYFGDLARYCDPSDLGSIRSSVLEAYETAREPEDRERLKDHVATHFNWQKYGEATLDVYNRTLQSFTPRDIAYLNRSVPAAKPVDGRLKIVFDVTTTANHRGRWTGITRVEVALAYALSEHAEVDVQLVAWADKARRFVPVPLDALYPDQLGIYVAYTSQRDDSDFSVPAGTLFIMAGSAWMQNPRYAEAVTSFAAERQLVLTPVFHDLIPIQFPFWFNDGYAPVFEKNLMTVMTASPKIIAISENTKKDVEAFALSRNLIIPEVSIFREGDNIRIPSFEPVKSDIEKGEEIKALLGEVPFVLTVGAIHVRKNHKMLYDVWVRLAETLEHRCPHLVIVGGVAWNGHDIARVMRTDARVKHLIHILEDVDDDILEWLYTSCIFTAYPSLYEGWGLPVGESLRFGKLCVAASSSSVPEIAPEFTTLIDPLDFKTWYTTIYLYSTSRSAREERAEKIRAGYRPTEWIEAAGNLLTALGATTAPGAVPNLYSCGDVVSLGDLDSAVRYKTLSWYATESWGTWSSGPRAGVSFVLARPYRGPFLLVVRARVLLAANTTFTCGIAVNGKTVSKVVFLSGALQTHTFFLPTDVCGPDGRVNIRFDNERLQRIAELTSAKEDKRRVGIGVASIAILDLGHQSEILPYIDPRQRTLQRPGKLISLLTDPVSQDMVEGSWVKSSAWGAWSESGRPRLKLTVHEDPDADLLLEFAVRGIATEAKPTSVLVMANGKPVTRWHFLNDRICRQEIKIPAAVRLLQQPLILDFVGRTDQSPASLGLGNEKRNFGFGLFEMRFGTESLFKRWEGTRAEETPIYEIGKRIAFYGQPAAGLVPAAPFLQQGWLPSERAGTWTFGDRATLQARIVEPVDRELLLDVTIRGFGTVQLGPIDANVRINGAEVLPIRLPTDDFYAGTSVVTPEVLAGASLLTIEVSGDRVASPFSLGSKRDDRLLGIHIGTLRLRHVAAYELSAPIDFADQTVGNLVLADNWYGAEPDGQWTRGAIGTVYLGVGPETPAPLKLMAIARVMRKPEMDDVEVHVSVNDCPCGTLAFTDEAFQLLDFEIPDEAFDGSTLLKVRFEQPAVTSAALLGRNARDTRLVGVLVRSLAVAPAENAEEAALALPGADRVPYLAAILAERARIAEYENAILPIAVFGEALSLGSDAVLPVRFKGSWYEPELEGVWTDGSGGSFFIRLPEGVSRPVRLSVSARTHGTPVRGPAAVDVTVDRQPAARWTLEHDRYHSFEIDVPAADSNTPIIEIGFDCPAAVSPAAIGASDDTRVLGLFIRSVTALPAEDPADEAASASLGSTLTDVTVLADPELGRLDMTSDLGDLDSIGDEPAPDDDALDVPTLVVGEPLSFAAGATVGPKLSDHWYGQEVDGAWTDGSLATVTLRLPGPANRPARLAVDARIYGTAFRGRSAVNVSVNGHALTVWVFDDDGYHTSEILVPTDILAGSSVIVVGLEKPDTVSPSEVEGSADTRRLGINVRSVTALDQGITEPTAPDARPAQTEFTESFPDPETINAAAEPEPAEDEDAGPSPSEDAAKPAEAAAPEAVEPADTGASLAEPVDEAPPEEEQLQGEADVAAITAAPELDEVDDDIEESTEEITPPPVKEAPVERPSGAASELPILALGEPLSFSSAAAIRPKLMGAWHGLEVDGAWTDGSPASFLVRLPDGGGKPIRLDIDARIYGTLFRGPGTVNVTVNGTPAPVWTFDHDGYQANHILVPAEVLARTTVLEISLRRPDAFAPADVAESDDIRRLGINVRSVIALADDESEIVEAAQGEEGDYEEMYGSGPDAE